MRQKLGQHFLKNKSAIKKIAGALDFKPGDTIIEIGPGHGELTQELAILTHKMRLVMIERDENLVGELKTKFSEMENVEVLAGDALEVLPGVISNLKSTNYKLVGNIPYYITGKLFRLLSDAINKPSLSVFTIQLEVAERMTAVPPKMNRLAAIIQLWAEPSIIMGLSRNDFSPAPEVDSAVVKLKVKDENLRTNGGDYYKMVRILFQQPRKTVLNNLAEILPDKEKITLMLAGLGIDGKNRPQDLGVEEILEIARKFEVLDL
ncbi:MAG: 16S rRNA (adenine1518-N6/adenine1519-N6)-dimethyltransferase [Parcubacteria group bacterium Gr01-1014_20]|nr:MAG: 16S rRNA (adenine1518-N6/adenine1519-N6)-dimethyltransferase [Parcubacteria group bacterium Gr01-1014_20]